MMKMMAVVYLCHPRLVEGYPHLHEDMKLPEFNYAEHGDGSKGAYFAKYHVLVNSAQRNST